MRSLIIALIAGILCILLDVVFWQMHWKIWDSNLISMSGLIAGVFFSLAIMFQSALHDYKEADKKICDIRAKICSMNDININAAMLSGKKYDPKPFADTLKNLGGKIEKYLGSDAQFSSLQKEMDNLTVFITGLDKYIPANKVSRIQQYHDHLRGLMSYLEYGKSLVFPLVGYIFLYFFIGLLLILQLFSHTESLYLELVFIFSLASLLFFFSSLIVDLDRPFKRNAAAFKVDLSPLKRAKDSITHSLTLLK